MSHRVLLRVLIVGSAVGWLMAGAQSAFGGELTPTNQAAVVQPAPVTKTAIGVAITIVRCRPGMVKTTKRVHGYRVVACVARHAHRRHKTRLTA